MAVNREYLEDIVNEMAQNLVEGEQSAVRRLAMQLWNQAFEGDQPSIKMIYEMLIKSPVAGEERPLADATREALEKVYGHPD